MRVYSFQKLRVYQLALDIVVGIYDLTKPFPDDERYGLRSQVRRSITSVSANIAEGSGAISGREQARFTVIAFRSLMETVQHLEVAERLHYITPAQRIATSGPIDKLANMLNAYRKSQLQAYRNANQAREDQAAYGLPPSIHEPEELFDFPEFSHYAPITDSSTTNN